MQSLISLANADVYSQPIVEPFSSADGNITDVKLKIQEQATTSLYQKTSTCAEISDLASKEDLPIQVQPVNQTGNVTDYLNVDESELAFEDTQEYSTQEGPSSMSLG